MDRLNAGKLLKANQSLSLRIEFVEFEGQRAGEVIEPLEEAADDFFADGIQSLKLAGCRY
jgi:hypothetical protein